MAVFCADFPADEMNENFSKSIIGWYRLNKRDLPWRNTRDPYKIWLSEIILQQTQVAQGLAYYLAFTNKYPDIQHLARASEDEILKTWQGLGYYSRARNLHFTAKMICMKYKGRFPTDYESLLGLKGVGSYTAAAIASFSFDLPHAVLDGNVFRVLSRVFGIDLPVDGSEGRKVFNVLAETLLNKKNPALHNQALMEFGALQCRPVNPACDKCVLAADCYAFRKGKVRVLPVKAKKVKVRNRYFSYLVIADQKNNVLLNRRMENDIWKGLYEFRLVENSKRLSKNSLFSRKEIVQRFGENFTLKFVSPDYVHQLTHQRLHARFYVLQITGKFTADDLSSPVSELHKFAFPRLISKFLEDCDLKELFYF